jgi:hypothetical protein
MGESDTLATGKVAKPGVIAALAFETYGTHLWAILSSIAVGITFPVNARPVEGLITLRHFEELGFVPQKAEEVG